MHPLGRAPLVTHLIVVLHLGQGRFRKLSKSSESSRGTGRRGQKFWQYLTSDKGWKVVGWCKGITVLL
jgi:hypothetical protein